MYMHRSKQRVTLKQAMKPHAHQNKQTKRKGEKEESINIKLRNKQLQHKKKHV